MDENLIQCHEMIIGHFQKRTFIVETNHVTEFMQAVRLA